MWVLLLAAALGAETNAGETLPLLRQFRDEFVAITPGEGKFPAEFTFGDATVAEKAAQPARKIVLKQPFAIAKFEVPQNLWQVVMGNNPSRWKGPRNAVETISHDDAVRFCRQATEQMRRAKLIETTEALRLPSEAEWEYCCRAGTTTLYSFGDDPQKLGEYAWFTGNAAGNDPPGGAKKANPWGLCDMHGYIREWCADAGYPTLEGGPDDGSPRVLGSTAKRVLRGGSWKDQADGLTSSSRMLVPSDTRDDAVGFRCVLATVSKEPPEFRPAAQEAFFPTGPKLEPLWGEGQFTEGPVAAADGSIFFSDIGNAIYRFDPATKMTTKFREPSSRSNGMKFTRDGKLVVCEGANTGGGRRISITSGIEGGKDGTASTLSAGFDGKRFNSPNDLALGPDGFVYFTDPRYAGEEPRELDFEGVFAIAPDGATAVATRDVQKPNGIVITADGTRAYVADNNHAGHKQLVSFKLAADHTFTEKVVLWDFGGGRGIDGMTLDRQGNIYATAGTGEHAGVHVFDAEGKPQAFIATPGDPTNCCFGLGDAARTLYVTAAVDRSGKKFGLFRITVVQAGYAQDR